VNRRDFLHNLALGTAAACAARLVGPRQLPGGARDGDDAAANKTCAFTPLPVSLQSLMDLVEEYQRRVIADFNNSMHELWLTGRLP